MRNITVIAGQAMTEETKSSGQPTEQNKSEAVGVSRREALGRFGAYTAPALLAMLVSDKAFAASDAAPPDNDEFQFETISTPSLSPVNERVRIRPRLGTQQLGQAGNVRRDAPCLIAREQTGSRAPAGLILEIDEGQRLLFRVPDDEARLSFFDRPGRREAAGHN